MYGLPNTFQIRYGASTSDMAPSNGGALGFRVEIVAEHLADLLACLNFCHHAKIFQISEEDQEEETRKYTSMD